jgi:hypothetical protein
MIEEVKRYRRRQTGINCLSLLLVAIIGFFYWPLLSLGDQNRLVGYLVLASPFILIIAYFGISEWRKQHLKNGAITDLGIWLTIGVHFPVFLLGLYAGLRYWPSVNQIYALHFA